VPWRLLYRNIVGHPLRSLLTLGSVAVVVFLVSMLHAVSSGLSRTVAATAANRLLVQSAVSLYVDLPVGYQQKLAQVPGIDAVCKWQWFGGRYEQDKGGFFTQFAVDADTWGAIYPEMRVVDGSLATFQTVRTACVVGRALAAKYGWQVGQTVPILGTIFTRTDGRPWEFTIAGLYASSSPSIDEQTMYFRFDYLRESLEQGGAIGPEGVGVYVLRVAPGNEPATVQQAVDALFANGPQRTRTMTEAEFTRQFITMLGDLVKLLPVIGGAVVFAMFFAVLNTMLLAGRERTRDIGIMKALGFSNAQSASLLLVESVTICAIGAAAGIALALALERVLKPIVETRMPGFGTDAWTLALGAGLALATGLLSGAVPARIAARQSAVGAMREIV
jgi:putative ABC transport system permease protein